MKTTNWKSYQKFGSYFRLIEGTLFQAPMLENGEISQPNDPIEVDWNEVAVEPSEVNLYKELKAIEKELEANND